MVVADTRDDEKVRRLQVRGVLLKNFEIQGLLARIKSADKN